MLRIDNVCTFAGMIWRFFDNSGHHVCTFYFCSSRVAVLKEGIFQLDIFLGWFMSLPAYKVTDFELRFILWSCSELFKLCSGCFISSKKYINATPNLISFLVFFCYWWWGEAIYLVKKDANNKICARALWYSWFISKKMWGVQSSLFSTVGHYFIWHIYCICSGKLSFCQHIFQLCIGIHSYEQYKAADPLCRGKSLNCLFTNPHEIRLRHFTALAAGEMRKQMNEEKTKRLINSSPVLINKHRAWLPLSLECPDYRGGECGDSNAPKHGTTHYSFPGLFWVRTRLPECLRSSSLWPSITGKLNRSPMPRCHGVQSAIIFSPAQQLDGATANHGWRRPG